MILCQSQKDNAYQISFDQILKPMFNKSCMSNLEIKAQANF